MMRKQRSSSERCMSRIYSGSMTENRQLKQTRHTYRHHKQSAQARLRAMKEQWWSDRATELQEAADRKNAKLFYDGLKAIYGPQANGSSSILSAGAETRLTEPSGILERWAQHFSDVLNRSRSQTGHPQSHRPRSTTVT